MNIFLLYANGVKDNSFPHVYDPLIMSKMWDYYNFYDVYDLFEDPILDNNLIIFERNYLGMLEAEHLHEVVKQIKACKNKKIIILYHYKSLSADMAAQGLHRDKHMLYEILGYEPTNVMYITQLYADIKHVKNVLGEGVKVTYYDKWLEELNRYQIQYGFVRKKKFHAKNVNIPEKLFSLFVRRYEDIRFEVLCEFISADLLSDFHFTFAARGGYHPEGDIGLSIAKYINNLPERYLHAQDKIRQWASHIPYEIDTFGPGQVEKYPDLYTPTLGDYFICSKINIILETHFHNNRTSLRADHSIITEKTYKAILYKKPFMLISQPNTLEVLKECGYKTFGHVINETYDKCDTVPERLRLISNECQRIRNLDKNNLQYLLDSCTDIIEHNYNHMLRESFRTIPPEFTIQGFINSR